MTTDELLVKASSFINAKYYPYFAKYCDKYNINTPLRLAHFLSQVNHESGDMKYIEENLNYSAKRLLQVFPKYFKTIDGANEYAYKPEKIANKIYTNRMGNGNEASGDGWRYRGRGPIQLTGKNNYILFANWVKNKDIINNPDLILKDNDLLVLTAFFYWDYRKINNIIIDNANQYEICKKVTRAINGGYNGLDDRWQRFQKIYNKLNT